MSLDYYVTNAINKVIQNQRNELNIEKKVLIPETNIYTFHSGKLP